MCGLYCGVSWQFYVLACESAEYWNFVTNDCCRHSIMHKTISSWISIYAIFTSSFTIKMPLSDSIHLAPRILSFPFFYSVILACWSSSWSFNTLIYTSYSQEEGKYTKLSTMTFYIDSKSLESQTIQDVAVYSDKINTHISK